MSEIITRSRGGDESTVWSMVKPDLVIVDVYDDGSVVILAEKDGKREVIEALVPAKK